MKIAGLEERLQELEKRLKEPVKEKRVIVPTIDPEFRSHYEKVLRDKDQIFHNFDIIYGLNPKNCCRLCEEILEKPTEREVEESAAVQRELEKALEKDSEDGVAIILLGLKKFVEEDGGTFTLHRKSNAQTQLSVKILTSGFLEDLVKATEHVADTPEWNFEAIHGDDERLEKFIAKFAKEKSVQHNVSPDDIIVTRLTEGSI